MRKLVLFAGIAALGLLYGCGNDSTVVPEPGPGPTDSVIEIPGEPLPDYIRPVLTEGKRWVKRSKDKPTSEDYSPNYTVVIAKDTVLRGVTAKKILRVESDGTTSLERIALEIDSRVYKFDMVSFRPDYDCFPQFYIGFTDFKQIFTPVSKGIITLQGKQRRCTKVLVKAHWYSGLDYEATDYWVEGIGPLMGYTRNFYNGPFPSSVSPHTQFTINTYYEFEDQVWPWLNEVLECYDGDEKIYDYREFSPDLYFPLDTIDFVYVGYEDYYPDIPNAQ